MISRWRLRRGACTGSGLNESVLCEPYLSAMLGLKLSGETNGGRVEGVRRMRLRLRLSEAVAVQQQQQQQTSAECNYSSLTLHCTARHCTLLQQAEPEQSCSRVRLPHGRAASEANRAQS